MWITQVFFLKAETLFQGETEIGILPLKWDEHGVKTPGEIAKALALLSALFEQWKSHRNPWWNIGKSHRNIGKSHFKSFEKGGFFIASLVIITGHIRTPFLGCAAKLVNVFFFACKTILSMLEPSQTPIFILSKDMYLSHYWTHFPAFCSECVVFVFPIGWWTVWVVSGLLWLPPSQRRVETLHCVA